MNKTMFGLLALGLLAGVAFAHPPDYNMWVRLDGSIRYVGADSPSVFSVPVADATEYRAVHSIYEVYALYADPVVARECPRVNGVMVCE